MRSFLRYTLALLTLSLLGGAAFQAVAQDSAAAATSKIVATPAVDTEKIVRAFTAKETQFRQALNNYAFKRDAVVQTIGMGGQITGEYHRVSFFTFDDQGNRYEKISFFPMSTLTELSVSEQDLEDLGGVNAFALETSKISLYNFKYVGKERIDELDLYVFDVSPKVIPDAKKTKERFFQGRIWVDDHDLQIVKARGKGIPEDKNNKYPTFDSYREQIDGRYWFPTYTYADEDIVFGSGQVVHLRLLVRYTEYKQGHADVKITEDPNPDEPETKKPESKPTPEPLKKPE